MKFVFAVKETFFVTKESEKVALGLTTELGNEDARRLVVDKHSTRR